MRIAQAHVAFELFIALFGAADAGFLLGGVALAPFLQIVAVFLQQHIAAAGIGAIGNHRHFGTRFILRVFGAVYKTIEAALFQQAVAVGFVGHADAVAECGQHFVGQRDAQIMAQRLNVNQHIVLGGRRKAAAQRAERLDVAAFFAAAEALPQAAAESDGEAERGIGKLCLQIGQRSKALRAGLFDGIGAALGIGFDKNARFAVVGHNGALRSVHRGSFRVAVGEMDCGF